MKFLAFAFALAALIRAEPGAAQPAAIVEAVQMPAWVERSESGAPARRVPVAAGMALRTGDELRTGAGSRLLLRLAEGSLMKLGENATLKLHQLEPGRELFKGAMSVLEGAFRFTTQLVTKKRRRDINIHVSQVTAGIRGTDLWGRSREDNQIVCLIEGEIEVGAADEKPVTMDKPLQFYQRTQGQTRPIGFVEPKQLAEWAKETEIEPGRGAARRGGTWKVVLASLEDQNAALAVYDQVREAGYAAEIRPTAQGEKRIYAVRIANLPSKAEAEALAVQLRGKNGVAEPRVTR